MKKIVVMILCLLPVASMAMADRTAPVYGRPTLYGEYEMGAPDTGRAAVLYGAVPKNAAAKMPVKDKKVISKKSAEKKKTAKKAAMKKATVKKTAAKKAKPVSRIAAEKVHIEKKKAEPVKMPEPVVEVKEEALVVAEKKMPTPSVEAVAIASAAVSEVPSIDTFCTQRGVQRKGNLPDGVVLMPGRPDLMSCSEK